MSDSILEKATSALSEATKTDVFKGAVDNVVTRGIEGGKSVLHNLEEKKDQVSSKIVGAVSQFTGGSADSSATTRDLPVSTDNQPLLSAGETATPWWKSCCEILDLLKTSSSSTEDQLPCEVTEKR